MNAPRPAPHHAPPPAVRCGAREPVVRLESQSLFGDAREAVIVHQGEEYRLRITRLDKLILTK